MTSFATHFTTNSPQKNHVYHPLFPKNPAKHHIPGAQLIPIQNVAEQPISKRLTRIGILLGGSHKAPHGNTIGVEIDHEDRVI
jgi:hypothetical protein